MSNYKEIRNLLRETYQELFEAPKKQQPVTAADLKARQIKPSVIKNLDTSIKEWKKLEDEIQARYAELNAELEQKVNSQSEHYDKVYNLLKQLHIESYQVSQLVADMSKEYERSNTKYKEIYEEALERVNTQARRVLRNLYNRHTNKIKVPSSLTIESKQTKAITRLIEEYTGKKVVLKENFWSWIKSTWKSLVDSLSGLKSARKNLEQIMAKTAKF